MIFVLFSAYFYAHFTTAAPVFANSTNSTALRSEISPAWVPDPSGRGTWGILWSCLSTLFVCAFTSLHLNIPSTQDTQWHIRLRQAKWVVVAIFAPEVVVFTAFAQWSEARKFLKDLAKGPKRQNYPSASSRSNSVYAWYAVMGGFGVEVTDIHNRQTSMSITPEGLLLLANKFDYLIYDDKIDIKDKSKTDTIGKALVCMQTLWIVCQTIERKIAGYPVTLLEVHTIAHVFCALTAYALWLHKPLNVTKSTLIRSVGTNSDQKLMEILAYMLQATCNSYGDINRGFHVEPLDTSRQISMTRNTSGEPCILWYGHPASICGFSYSNFEEDSAWSAAVKLIQLNISQFSSEITQWLPSSHEKVTSMMHSNQPSPSGTSGLCLVRDSDDNSQIVFLTSKDEKRLDLVANFVHRNIADIDKSAKFGWRIKFRGNGDMATPTIMDFSAKKALLAPRMKNFNFYHSADLNQTFGRVSVLLAVTIALAAYGSVHLLGLQYIFPTATERTLWKISCYILLGFAGVMAATFCLSVCINAFKCATNRDFEHLDLIGLFKSIPKIFAKLIARSILYPFYLVFGSFECDFFETLADWLWWLTELVVMGLPILAYILARLYIVVESFISLRHVPVGVYETPKLNIMGNFPHL